MVLFGVGPTFFAAQFTISRGFVPEIYENSHWSAQLIVDNLS